MSNPYKQSKLGGQFVECLSTTDDRQEIWQEGFNAGLEAGAEDLHEARRERDEAREAMAAVFAKWGQESDSAYVRMIAIARRPESLGWEAKVRCGDFGRRELDAHVAGGEQIGRHRALAQACRDIHEIMAPSPPRRSETMTDATREMSLEEYLGRLGESHRARREWRDLRTRLAAAEGRDSEELAHAKFRIARLDRENGDLCDRLEQAHRERDEAREAIANILAIIEDSTGVVGWHLNGAYAEWAEFEEVDALVAALGPAEKGRAPLKATSPEAACDYVSRSVVQLTPPWATDCEGREGGRCADCARYPRGEVPAEKERGDEEEARDDG